MRNADIPPDWTRYIARHELLPRLLGANSNPLQPTADFRLAVRLHKIKFDIPFVVAEQLAFTILLAGSSMHV